MPRKKLIHSNQIPCHITARSNNREWFALSPRECWDVFSDFLFFANKAFDLRTHAFVLMPNHFHLLASTPGAFLPEIMNRFMTETSFAINDKSLRTNHVFGSRYHASLIKNPYYFGNAMKYIYRNPVASGLCQKVEEYEWSSLSRTLGAYPLHFPVTPFLPFDSVLPVEMEKRLAWFNRKFENKTGELIGRAFCKSEFKVAARRTSSPGYDVRVVLC